VGDPGWVVRPLPTEYQLVPSQRAMAETSRPPAFVKEPPANNSLPRAARAVTARAGGVEFQSRSEAGPSESVSSERY
jgi:hypothetical protein